jgi:PilZ domain-containing protein
MAMRQIAADRRRIDRPRRRTSVRYGTDQVMFLGYTLEMGDKGMFLQGNQLFPPGTLLNLDLETPDGPASARGVVRWVKEVPPVFRRSMRGGMGIEIIERGRR